jgi:hypothetical protein
VLHTDVAPFLVRRGGRIGRLFHLFIIVQVKEVRSYTFVRRRNILGAQANVPLPWWPAAP